MGVHFEVFAWKVCKIFMPHGFETGSVLGGPCEVHVEVHVGAHFGVHLRVHGGGHFRAILGTFWGAPLGTHFAAHVAHIRGPW